ncbi:ribosomal subunit interface protein [Alicyclobacillus contaminans]|uniref:ribosome hibernation-promoting factor, HPF/YfiA family n=1 Tax=Alicyclobacillus contaminans TaxID=392016 RepID=UPI00040DCD27|nr:ribosome-associated translation inhibitor RaiA [Alicyclobacillus contaminans]GMA51162.1 ribosomal subunit interface protein [Alicyclobacillus contaminans]
MLIQTYGDHIPLTDALREYLEKKLSRLERYVEIPADTQVHAALSVERGMHKVEITLTLFGYTFRAEERSSDMYASIDLATDTLCGQVQKYKSRLHRHSRDGQRRDVQPGDPEARNDDGPKVVRVKRFAVKPMALEEAMLQMELLGHDFFVFTNAETDEMNVLYRRKDGNFGWIEPQ